MTPCSYLLCKHWRAVRHAWVAERRGDGRNSSSMYSWWPVQPPETRALLMDRAHKRGRNMPRQESCSYLPWHVFLNWEMFPAGNACRDSYRGINLPPRVCLCTWLHVHAHNSYPRGGLLLGRCTEGWIVARTAHSPCSFAVSFTTARLLVPVPWNPARVVLLRFVILLIIFLWLALTSVKTRVWEPVQESQNPHKPQCTPRAAPTPASWPPSRLMPPSLGQVFGLPAPCPWDKQCSLRWMQSFNR